MGILKGGAVGTTEVVIDEVVAGDIDGINKVFTTSVNYASGSLTVFLNGLQQSRPDDYSETSANSFTFVNAPQSIGSADIVTARYARLS